MSNPSSSPASRPLEQLKVAELREELKKRGLNLKGVKKELFERLDAAIREEQSGAPLGGSDGTLEGDQGSVDEESIAQETGDHKGPQEDQDENTDESVLSSKDAALIVDNASPYVGASDATPVIEELHKATETLEPVSEESKDAGQSNIADAVPEAGNINAGGDIPEATLPVVVNQATDNDPSLTQSIGDGDSALPEFGEEASKDEPLHVLPESQCQDDQTGLEPEVVAVPEDTHGKDSPDGENLVLVQEYGGIIIESDLSGVVSQSVGEKHDGIVSITDNSPSLADASIPAMDNTLVANDYPVEDVRVFEKTNLTSVSVAPCVQEQVEDQEDGVSCMADASIPNLEGMNHSESQVLMPTSEDQALMEIRDASQEPDAVKQSAMADVVEDMTLSKVPPDVTSDIVMQEVVEDVVKLKENQDVAMSESEQGLIADEKTVVASMEPLVPLEDEKVAIPQPADSEKGVGSGSGRALDKMRPPKVEYESQKERGSMPVKSEQQGSKEELPRTGKTFDRTRSRDGDYDRHRHGTASGIKDGQERNRADGRAGRVFKEERMDVKELDLKPEKDKSQFQSSQKRKEEEDAKQQEPAKRMRRWNSGNQLAAETAKPLTTGTVKEIMSPEIKKEGPVAIAPKLPPKTLGQSRSLAAAVKADPDANGDNRAVPPSTRPPSSSLKIERFVRPFTLNAVKDMLAEFGSCVDFWMDQIKTHCYVTFMKVDEAVAARNALYGKQWPPSYGNHLVADFVDASEVKIRCDGSFEKATAAPPLTPRGAPNLTPAPPASTQHGQANARASAPPLREREPMQPPPMKQPDPPTLDDLFRKTMAKPHIYYLPLTDEQVAAKLAAAKNKELQSKSRSVGRA